MGFKKNLGNGYHSNEKKFLKKFFLNGIFARKTVVATDLKLGMYILLHSGSNMGWVPPGHTFLSLCKAINAKNGISAKTIEPRELDQ